MPPVKRQKEREGREGERGRERRRDGERMQIHRNRNPDLPPRSGSHRE